MKKIFLYFSIAILLIAIPATIFLVGKNQEIRKRAAPASTLFIAPSSITKKVGESFSLDIKLDPAANQVGTVQISLEYDPTKLKADDITNGAIAPSILASGKVDQAGIASIKVGAKSNAEPIREPGTIAVVTMTAIAATTAPITVKFSAAPNTYANGFGEGASNVLIGMTPTTITILNADGTSASVDNTLVITPSATPLPTLSPTPTATPSATPTLANDQVATSAALTITSITPNENVTTSTPTFSGKVQPGYIITLTIYSEPQTVIVTVDANGNWTYTPQAGLENGPHTVTALATDPTTGLTQTATVPFVISDSQSASESAMPVSGNTSTTFLLLASSILLFFIGAFVPYIIR